MAAASRSSQMWPAPLFHRQAAVPLAADIPRRRFFSFLLLQLRPQLVAEVVRHLRGPSTTVAVSINAAAKGFYFRRSQILSGIHAGRSAALQGGYI